jgi:N-formylglutamate amidohydrolase
VDATPIVATAIHAGHDVRAEVAALLALDDAVRLREEDPFTDLWAQRFGTWITVQRSRFEVDLNRPREGAVYRRPEDAWGMAVWRTPPPDSVVARSLALYDEFYEGLERVLADAQETFGQVVVLDLHSYNHRRDGPDSPAAEQRENPDINVGTGSMDVERWAHVVECFMARLADADVRGRKLDVRANVRFEGGHLSRWVHERFPASCCAIAVEVKKLFMDEHTGELDPEAHAAIGDALASTVPVLVDALAAG